MPPKKKKANNIDFKCGNDMVNLYETPAVKKYLPEKNNPSFPHTQIELNSRILVVGASGSGKTNWLCNYLQRCPDTYSHIHICYKEQEPLYQTLKEKLKKSITFYTSPKDIPRLEDIRKDKDGKEDPTDNILLCVDDWVDQAHRFPNMDDIFLRGRKFVTTLFITQSYYKVPKFWRSQLTYIILIKVSGDKDLKLILSDYSLGLDKNQLFELYNKATKKKFNFFKLDINQSDPNKKYSHNWTDFYHVKDESEDEEDDSD